MPGSKSQTNRALVLAALAAREGGTSTVSGALRSRDTDLMIRALRSLGFDIIGDGTDLTVSPGAGDDDASTVDCGLAGTVLRFLPPVAALRHAPTVFDGDEQARARPIAPLLDALRSTGVGIDGQHLPFTVTGTGQVQGGEVGVDASGSSQFVSGLLLSGAAFSAGLTAMNTADVLPSGPHVVMTVTMLREAGIAVDDSVPGRWRIDPQPIPAHQWVIEPDLSNALAFIAPALATGGTVRITGWPRQSTQPARQIEDVVRQFAQTVSLTDTHLEVTGQSGYGGVDLTSARSASSPPPLRRCPPRRVRGRLHVAWDRASTWARDRSTQSPRPRDKCSRRALRRDPGRIANRRHRPARRRLGIVCRSPDGHRWSTCRAEGARSFCRRHRHHQQDTAGLPGMWADMIAQSERAS